MRNKIQHPLTVILALALSLAILTCRDSVSPPPRNLYDWQPTGLQTNLVIRFKEFGNTIYACAGARGLWKRPKSGGAWEYAGLADSSMNPLVEWGVIDLAVRPADPNILVALFQPDTFSKHGVYRSTDGGASWSPADSGLTYTVDSTVAYHRFGRFLGYSDTLHGLSSDTYLSRDFGTSWASSGRIGSVPGRIYALYATGSDSQDVWIGGENYFFMPILAHSIDGARTWENIDLRPFFPLDDAVFGILVNPLDKNIIFAGMPGKLVKSSDRGQTWTDPIATEIDGNLFRTIISDPETPSQIWTAAGRLVLYSTDSGVTWDTIDVDVIIPASIYDMRYDAATSSLMLGTNNGVWEAFVK